MWSTPSKSMKLVAFLATLFVSSSVSLAIASSDDDELARAQAQMNAEVMSKPFLAEKPEEVDKYIESMLKQNIKPEEYKGNYWRTGYTCRDLLRYSWVEYRNCKYYYRYHGRYYY